MNELKQLAKKSGVDLRGPMVMPDSSGGKYIYAIAASPFTVGEYACSIHANDFNGLVEKKQLGY